MIAVASLVATAGVAAPATAQATPTCFGEPATIIAVAGRVTVGTAGPDVIVGTPGRDVIRSLGGDDLVCSRGGNDRVVAGAGDDTVDLGSGRDRGLGRRGNDRLLGKAGRDRLIGGPGLDELIGGPGPDRLVGGPGVDRLDGGAGLDRLIGGGGDDDCGTAVRDIRSRCSADEPTAPAPVAVQPEGPLIADPPPNDPDEGDDGGGGGGDEPPAVDPELAALIATIEDDVLGVYGAANPWLVQAWNYIDTNGDVLVENPGPFVAGQVRTVCGGTAGLPQCRATSMKIHPDYLDDVDVIIHELAHVWERTHGLAPDRGAAARAQWYFLENHGAQCHPAEALADTMLMMVRPEAGLAYFDFACPALPDEPTSEMVAVIDAMFDGVDHPWFTSAYANGTAAWTEMMSLTEETYSFERFVLVYNLADEFGGYCSIGNTIDAAFFDGADVNPWADDGC